MAEREGFEPSKPVKVYTLSRRADSTTLTPLRRETVTISQRSVQGWACGESRVQVIRWYVVYMDDGGLYS